MDPLSYLQIAMLTSLNKVTAPTGTLLNPEQADWAHIQGPRYLELLEHL